MGVVRRTLDLLGPVALGLPVLAAAPGAQQAGHEVPQRERLEKLIERHPYFSRVGLDLVEERPPFLFLVQRPPKEEPGYAERIAAENEAILAPTLAAFEARLATPFGLDRRADEPLLVVAVLPSAGDFDNYLRVSPASWHLEAGAAVDDTLGAAVVHETAFGSSRDPAERVRAARHVAVHLMQAAWFGGTRDAPTREWLLEGVADYLARLPADGTPPGADPAELRDLVAAACDPARRWESLRTIPELFTVARPMRLDAFLRVEAKKRKLPDADVASAMLSFYRQAALLVCFLQEGDDGAHAAGFESFLAGVMTGQEPERAFGSAFPGEDTSALEAAFLRWLAREHQRLWPGIDFDVPTLLGGGGADAAGDAPPRAGVKAVAEVVLPALALDDATPRERLATAVWEVRQGRATAGLAEIDQLVAEDPGGGERERIARERARVAAWIELRDGFLEHVVADGELLQFEYRGRSSRTRIEAIEDGHLVLEPNRLGVSRIEIESMPPTALARQMSKYVSGRPDGWVRVYPYVIEGDSRWKRFLEDEDEEAASLRADAEEDYPELLRTAEAAELLAELVGLPDPESPAEAQEALGLIGRLRGELGDLPLVGRRSAALRAHARAIAGVLFDLEKPWSALGGELEELGGGRVAIEWDFDDPEELQDFESRAYLSSHMKKFGKLRTEEEHGFRVEDGALRGIGLACLRSLVDLAAPMTVSYELSFHDVKGIELPVWWLNVGLCDDGDGHFVWGLNADFLEVWEPEGQRQAYPEENQALYMDQSYRIELRHDGEKVESFCDGAKRREIACGSRRAGAVFVWCCSDFPVRIDSLRIEGRTTPDSFQRLRRAWVERTVPD